MESPISILQEEPKRTYSGPILNNEENITNSDEHAVAEVCNPIIKDDAFRKHVLYTIKGNDSSGAFEAYRRFKDFRALRKLMIRH